MIMAGLQERICWDICPKNAQKATFCRGGESQWMKAIFDEVNL